MWHMFKSMKSKLGARKVVFKQTKTDEEAEPTASDISIETN